MSQASSTCSMGAGGLWMPFHCDDPSTNRWSRTTLLSYLSLTETPSSPLSKHVEMIQATVYKNLPHHGQNDTDSYTLPLSPLPQWALDNPELNFQSLNMFQLSWQGSIDNMHIPDTLRESYEDAWTFRTPVVDSLKYMEALKLLCIEEGVEVKEDVEYTSPGAVKASALSLGCAHIVNCTGLSSSTLLPDPSLLPGRGVLYYYRRPEGFNTCALVDDGPVGTDCYPKYVIPRGDVVAVGGTYLEGDYEVGIRDSERLMLEGNAEMLLPGGGEGWEKVG
ncbi:hypothetical protein TrRE_jg13113, partial [Triparma retinervis]